MNPGPLMHVVFDLSNLQIQGPFEMILIRLPFERDCDPDLPRCGACDALPAVSPNIMHTLHVAFAFAFGHS